MPSDSYKNIFCSCRTAPTVRKTFFVTVVRLRRLEKHFLQLSNGSDGNKIIFQVCRRAPTVTKERFCGCRTGLTRIKTFGLNELHLFSWSARCLYSPFLKRRLLFSFSVWC